MSRRTRLRDVFTKAGRERRRVTKRRNERLKNFESNSDGRIAGEHVREAALKTVRRERQELLEVGNARRSIHPPDKATAVPMAKKREQNRRRNRAARASRKRNRAA